MNYLEPILRLPTRPGLATETGTGQPVTFREEYPLKTDYSSQLNPGRLCGRKGDYTRNETNPLLGQLTPPTPAPNGSL
jgi:hypothetical protein